MDRAIESVSPHIPREQPAETERAAWAGLIARIGIPAGVLTILMLPLFYVLVVSAAPDLGHPALELIGASQNLVAYKVYTLLEAVTFVLLSTLLFALGMVVRVHSSVIGTLIALAAAGNLVGILANFERLALIGGLAAAYPPAEAGARGVMEQTGAYFSQLYVAHIYMAWLMQSAASWLTASATPGIAGFPRWLARWLWLPGATGILLILGGAFGAPREISLALFSLHLPVSLGVACLGLARWARGRGATVGAPTTQQS